jgi:NAD(P)-dependent dehydrogenase (short-subunit alcohol dehydrogenase family)
MASLLGLLKTNKATIKATAASNKLYNPVHRPVGIFLGGTSGIGEAMATQLANQTGGRAHIILLGRNEEAAKRIIDRFPTATTDNATDAVSQQGQGQGAEGSKYEFIKVDATSMKSVREVTSRLNKELTKVNFIVATAGFTTSKGRDPTPPPESIDRKMACNFYARFRLIHDLIPLVEKAAANGEQVGVMSVLAAGRATAGVALDNLGLLRGYGIRSAQNHAVTYTDGAFEVRSHLSFLGSISLTNDDVSPGVCGSTSYSAFYAHFPWRCIYADGYFVSYRQVCSTVDEPYSSGTGRMRRGAGISLKGFIMYIPSCLL